MPEPEGLALYDAALTVASLGPLLEIGSYCGRSAIYLGAAAAEGQTILYSVDHHRGSEEHQPGEAYYDPEIASPDGRVDTLPLFREAIGRAGLESVVVAIVGDSSVVAAHWQTPLGMVFIDGGHAEATTWADYRGWPKWLVDGGFLAIHDVVPDPADGGRPPFEIYSAARESGQYDDVAEVGSLRILRRRPEPEDRSH
jgi:predicted O-methyltransferase YrrM